MHNRREMGSSSLNVTAAPGEPPVASFTISRWLCMSCAPRMLPTASFARCRTQAAWPCTDWEARLMEDASRQAHWDNVYTTKGENEVSWFQQSPAPSLELIVQVGATQASAIIDIG